MLQVAIGEYHFSYQLLGAGHTETLVCLHGFLGNSQSFVPLMTQLSQQLTCLAIDLPGHGNTKVLTSDVAYNMPHTARGIIDLLDRLNISPCWLLGYSMGGRLALYLLLHFPQYFQGAILESASPGLKTETERSHRRQADAKLAEELETGDFKNFLTAWYDRPLFQSLRSHPNFPELFANRLKNHPSLLAKSLRYMGTGSQPSLWEKLSENQCPLLLLVGECDRKFVSINTEIAKRCPMTSLEMIPHCGHTIHWEAPEIYLTKVRMFLHERNLSH